MDLQLRGTTGAIRMDDFVPDWESSFAFRNPETQAGYTHRTGMATRKDATFVPTPSHTAQDVWIGSNHGDFVMVHMDCIQ
jgi:hypothetical protein